MGANTILEEYISDNDASEISQKKVRDLWCLIETMKEGTIIQSQI